MGHHAGKPPVPLIRPATVIGSRSSARIHLISSTVSKAHALVVKSNGAVYIRDLASRGKLYINGDAVREADLQEGDLLKIGSFTFKFTAGGKQRAAEQPATPSELNVTDAEFPIPIDQRVVLIGRRSSADIVLLEESASTAHAVIFEMDGERFVRDLGSRTGTFVNGVSTHQHKLTPGDVIHIGETDIRYSPAVALESIQRASDSGAGYALEAPHEEIALAPGAPGDEHETMGGLDLMGQIVKEEMAKESAAPVSPAPAPPQADLEPLPLAEPPSVEPQPAEPEVEKEPAPPESPIAPAVAATSTDIEDIQDELLGDVSAPEESSSAVATPADSDLHPRRGWRTSVGDQTAPSEPQAPKEQSDEVLRFPQPSAPFDEHDGGIAVLDQDALSAQPTEDESFEPPEGFGELIDGAPTVDLADEPKSLRLDFPEPAIPASKAPRPAPTADEPLLEVGASEPTAADEVELKLDSVERATDAVLDFSVKEPSDGIPSLADLDHAPPPFKLRLEAEALADATQKLTRRTRKTRKKQDATDLSEGIAPFEPLAAPEAPDPFAAMPPVEKFDPFTGLETDAPAQFPTIEPLREEDARLDLPTAPEPTAAPPPLVVEPPPAEPEFAVDLDAATDAVELDDSAIARALADQTSEDLTDTKFTRAVEEFTGQSIGDIVEPAAEDRSQLAAPEPEPEQVEPVAIEPVKADAAELELEILAEPEVVPEPVQEPKPAETPVAEAPKQGPSEDLVIPREQNVPASKRAARPSPAMDPFMGANQDNFLGGIPLPRAKATKPTMPTTKPVPLQRDPVEELIAEIDSAAAAADRAKRDVPSDLPGTETVIDPFSLGQPPQPTQRPRPSPRRSVERPFPGNIDQTIPPFAESETKSGHASIGFDGLAMPPVRQADVFSAMSPPSTDLPAPAAGSETRASTDEEAPRGRADRGAFQVPDDTSSTGDESADYSAQGIPGATLADMATARRPVRPALSETALGGRPAVLYADEAELDDDDTEFKTRANRRALVMVLIGLVLIAAAVGAVYAFFPVEFRLEASIRYANLDKRTQRDREEIQQDQLRRLRADYLRESAKKKLLQTPEVSPGFLDDTVKYSRVVDRAFWPEPRAGQSALVLPVTGTNKQVEAARLRALAAALYDDNKDTLINPKKSLQSAVQKLKEDIARHERRRDELNGEIASQRILYERKPSAEHVKILEEKLSRLEDAWKRAVAAVKDAEAELDRIKSGASTDGDDERPEASDDELANMQKELGQLEGRMQETRAQRSETAKSARQKLDEAMQGFQQEIASARDAMNNNPELAAYIAAAQQLQDATRQLIDDLIRRQEQHFNSLNELKAQLNEKMESRRDEMWQADKELQKHTEELAIVTRQYNAAVGSGLKEEADEKLAQINLIKTMIKARQELIPVDPGYAEAIQRLELYVSSRQKDIAEDRKRTDELLSKLQSGFTSSPQIERLPAEQKELAQRLVSKLESINEARTAYNASLDAGAVEGEPQLQQQIAALHTGIEARKNQLADERAAQVNAAQNPEALQEKQAQLDTLKSQAKKAEDEYFSAREELDNARRAVSDARASYEKLEKLESERNDVQTLLRTQNDTLVGKQRELNEAVEPLPLGENDIRITDGADRRPTLAAIAAVAIGGIFVGLALLSLYRGPGRSSGALVPADLRPISHPVPQPSSESGNGQTAANRGTSNGNEDDHQPAVI